jgi:hypothetical protein
VQLVPGAAAVDAARRTLAQKPSDSL